MGATDAGSAGAVARGAESGAATAALLHHQLLAALGPEAFAWWGRPALDPEAALRVLVASGSPDPPGSLETGRNWARRALDPESPLSATLPEDQRELLRARLARVVDGPAAGERALRELLDGARAARRGGERIALDLAECLLDRRSPAEAAAWLAGRPQSAYRDRLLAWAHLAADDECGAREVLARQAPWSHRLPAPLARLRAACPDWLPLLSGLPDHVELREGAELPGADPDGRWGRPARGREDLGARLLAAVAVDDRGAPRVLWIDADRRAESGAARLALAAADRGGERELVATALPVQRRRSGAAPPEAVGGDDVRLVHWEPIADAAGEAVGWLRVEWTHHLDVAPGRLAATARTWFQAALESRVRPPGPPADPVPGARPGVSGCGASRAAAPAAADDPRQVFFERLARDLGARWTRRRWTGVVPRAGSGAELGPDGVELCSCGGADLSAADPDAMRRLLGRLARTRGPARIEVAAELHGSRTEARVAAGLPLLADGVLVGALVVEALRPSDLAAEDVERWTARSAGSGLGLLLARFQAWHARHYGWTPYLDIEGLVTGPLVRELVALAGARSAISVRGPAGSGRTVVARWLAWAGEPLRGPARAECPDREAADSPPREFRCRARGRSPEDALLAAAAHGRRTLLRDVEQLGPAAQRRLAGRLGELRACDDTVAPPVIVAPARGQRGSSAAREVAPELTFELASELGHLAIDVPGLAERRDELPGWAEHLVAAWARAEGLEPPRFRSDALGLVFRADWPGQFSELDALAHRLALLHPGRELGAELVRGELARIGLEVAERVPPRLAPPEIVTAALHAARRSGGAPNKTRAAALLGWDTSTLSARLRAAENGSLPGLFEAGSSPPE